jgi:hypothetical protein
MITDKFALCQTLKKVAARYHSDQQVTRTIASPFELERLWTLDSSAYGNCSIPFEQLLRWWQAYPNGITALFQQAVIQGAIEIWPLSGSIAQKLCAGKLSEREITADQMRPFVEAPCAHWYLSGMMLRTMQRKTAAIKAIITGTWSIFVAQSHFQFPMTISALGYSKEGICFLRRFGFRKLQNENAMPDRCALYSLQIDSWEDGVRFMRSRCLLGSARVKRRPALALSGN